MKRGVRAFDGREQVEARVSLIEGAESDPDIVWEIVEELGQRQAI